MKPGTRAEASKRNATKNPTTEFRDSKKAKAAKKTKDAAEKASGAADAKKKKAPTSSTIY
jgi:hypothetical protein